MFLEFASLVILLLHGCSRKAYAHHTGSQMLVIGGTRSVGQASVSLFDHLFMKALRQSYIPYIGEFVVQCTGCFKNVQEAEK